VLFLVPVLLILHKFWGITDAAASEVSNRTSSPDEQGDHQKFRNWAVSTIEMNVLQRNFETERIFVEGQNVFNQAGRLGNLGVRLTRYGGRVLTGAHRLLKCTGLLRRGRTAKPLGLEKWKLGIKYARRKKPN
jgi:hypothetical protein